MTQQATAQTLDKCSAQGSRWAIILCVLLLLPWLGAFVARWAQTCVWDETIANNNTSNTMSELVLTPPNQSAVFRTAVVITSSIHSWHCDHLERGVAVECQRCRRHCLLSSGSLAPPLLVSAWLSSWLAPLLSSQLSKLRALHSTVEVCQSTKNQCSGCCLSNCGYRSRRSSRSSSVWCGWFEVGVASALCGDTPPNLPSFPLVAAPLHTRPVYVVKTTLLMHTTTATPQSANKLACKTAAG